jgi:endonuclease/exonuclease/phosphatase family metal-dependent hydrolase
MMPRVALLLVVCAVLFSTCGSGGSESPTSPSAVSPVAGRPFKVMTFNIRHGIDGSDRYNLQSATTLIARIEPDLVGLQEITRNHPSYRCDDQPALMAEGLRRATGRPWTQVYMQEWFTPDKSCMQNGQGDGPETEGLAFLAPGPIGAVTSAKLWNGRIGLAVRPTDRQVSVIVTHLTSTAGARGAADRTKQVAQLLPFAESQGTPRILIGDLNNAATDAPLRPLMSTYHDAWLDAVQAGTSRGIPDGGTRSTKPGRVDYILYVPGTTMELEWAETVDVPALIGIEASDHRPVVASFRLR